MKESRIPTELIDEIMVYLPLHYSFGVSNNNIKNRFDHNIHIWNYAVYHNNIYMIHWLHYNMQNKWTLPEKYQKNTYLKTINVYDHTTIYLCIKMNRFTILQKILEYEKEKDVIENTQTTMENSSEFLFKAEAVNHFVK
ncbi:MAG: hypothetical protein ACRCZI_07475 [Cetobacterium sp.]